MSTTAILTYASRLTLQLYNAAGTNLVGNVFTLQVTKITPKKEQPALTITNSESPARRLEFVPGNQNATFSISGIVDSPATGNFDALFTSAMDGGLFCYVIYYVAKPGLPNINNALNYGAKTLFTDVDMDAEVSDEGGVLKFNANGKTIGGFTKGGTDAVTASGL